MKHTVLYIHGKGGSAEESAHFIPLFPGCEVTGLDYRAFTPWETGAEIHAALETLHGAGKNVTLIANSIGAYFTLHAGIDGMIQSAYFISPLTDMEELILGSLRRMDATEARLKENGTLPTPWGETLSWDYLNYVRSHPVTWNAPTHILFGSADTLIPFETVRAFAEKHNADLTVMEGGGHWFHTEEQMRFLDAWIRSYEMKQNDKPQ